MNFINDTQAAESLDAAVAAINAARKKDEEPKALAEVQPFVGLSQQLADSIVEAYQQQLTEIENKLADAKLIAERIREMTMERANDLANFRRRAQDFAESLLGAHQTFCEHVKRESQLP